MSTIGPPTVPPPVQAAAPIATATLASGTAAGMARLTPGTVITGTVISLTPQGQAVLQTPNGNLTLATNLNLQVGNLITLQVQTTGAQMQMVVLSVNHQVPSKDSSKPQGALAEPSGIKTTGGNLQGTAQAAAGAASGAAGTSGRAPADITSGSTLLGRVIGPRSGALSPVNGAAIGNISAILGGSPQGLSGAAPAAQSALLASQAASQSGGQGSGPVQGIIQASPAGGGGGVNAGLSLSGLPGLPGLPNDSRFNLRLIVFEPPPHQDATALLKSAAASRPPGTPMIAGTVTGMDARNQPIIETPLGTLSLEAQAALPKGGVAIFEVLGGLRPAPSASQNTFTPSLSQGTSWPELEEMIATLGRTDSVSAQHMINNVLPKTGINLSSGILLFISALRGGDISGWLGNMIPRSLEGSANGKLLKRVGDDFSKISRLASDGPSGDWKTMLIPIFDGSALNPVRLFVKPFADEANQGEDASEPGRRFIIDLELSQMGRLQFDGLVKSQSFDLILRSANSLEKTVKDEISSIFTSALEETGFSGSLDFQVTCDFIVPPLPQTMVHKGESPNLGLSV